MRLKKYHKEALDSGDKNLHNRQRKCKHVELFGGAFQRRYCTRLQEYLLLESIMPNLPKVWRYPDRLANSAEQPLPVLVPAWQAKEIVSVLAVKAEVSYFQEHANNPNWLNHCLVPLSVTEPTGF